MIRNMQANEELRYIWLWPIRNKELPWTYCIAPKTVSLLEPAAASSGQGEDAEWTQSLPGPSNYIPPTSEEYNKSGIVKEREEESAGVMGEEEEEYVEKERVMAAIEEMAPSKLQRIFMSFIVIVSNVSVQVMWRIW